MHMPAKTSPLPHSKHAGWFYSTKNSKMGFCLRESLSSRESCIHILYILSLPIFSSYSVVPLGEVELRVTVERVGTWLRTHLWYPPQLPSIWSLVLWSLVHSHTHLPRNNKTGFNQVPRNSQPALKVIKSWMMRKLISLLATALSSPKVQQPKKKKAQVTPYLPVLESQNGVLQSNKELTGFFAE